MIAAIVLAAGKSKRMGISKLLLPWGSTTVIGKILSTLEKVYIHSIIVVIGGTQEGLIEHLSGFPVEVVFNPDAETGEMLSSVQVGMHSLLDKDTKQSDDHERIKAAMLVLGDQPQIETYVVQELIDSYRTTASEIIVPSYQMHRGHPWLIKKSLWEEILKIPPNETLRDFLHRNNRRILHINVDTPSILQDLDTPEDYEGLKP